ncbi:MAG TPA: right-handed parallel beta-helix repeat-containing protein, partial [bacterium]|nr:right-handed parallel beta-helix repeat-containing protein [bacterium]
MPLVIPDRTRYVNVLDHGASTGASDNRDAFQRAINTAVSGGFKGVYFPAGTWNFNHPTPLDPGHNDLEFIGDGPLDTIINFDEGVSNGNNTGSVTSQYFLQNEQAGFVRGAARSGNIQIRDMSFTGTWNGDGDLPNGAWGRVTYLANLESLEVDNCHFRNLRSQGIALMGAERIKVTRCRFYRVAHDCVWTQYVFNQIIDGNHVDGCSDDVFGLHQGLTGGDWLDATGLPVEGVVVSNNVMEDVRGIVLTGIRLASVHHNILRRWKRVGIAVSASTEAGAEGSAPPFVVSIDHNQLIDGGQQESDGSQPALYAIAVFSAGRQGSTA